MRQRKDFQRIEGVKSSRLIVIAAEGRATENIYFEAMRQFETWIAHAESEIAVLLT